MTSYLKYWKFKCVDPGVNGDKASAANSLNDYYNNFANADNNDRYSEAATFTMRFKTGLTTVEDIIAAAEKIVKSRNERDEALKEVDAFYTSLGAIGAKAKGKIKLPAVGDTVKDATKKMSSDEQDYLKIKNDTYFSDIQESTDKGYAKLLESVHTYEQKKSDIEITAFESERELKKHGNDSPEAIAQLHKGISKNLFFWH